MGSPVKEVAAGGMEEPGAVLALPAMVRLELPAAAPTQASRVLYASCVW